MYLFDTDTISNVLKKRPSPRLIKKLKKLHPKEQFISTITLSEIVYGAYKSHRPDFHIQNLKSVLLPAINIVGFDSKSAYVCGKVRASLEKKGLPVPWADLQIASITIANEFTLIAGNLKHFNRIPGLTVENWL